MSVSALNNLVEPFKVVCSAGNVAYQTYSLSLNNEAYLPIAHPQHFRESNFDIFAKKVVNVISITGAGISGVATGVIIVLKRQNYVSALVYLRFLSVFGAMAQGAAAFVSLFRVSHKMQCLQQRLDAELLYSQLLKNTQREKELQVYQIAMSLDMASSFYSVSLSVITVLQFSGVVVIAASAATAILATGIALMAIGALLNKIYDIENIEREYLGWDAR